MLHNSHFLNKTKMAPYNSKKNISSPNVSQIALCVSHCGNGIIKAHLFFLPLLYASTQSVTGKEGACRYPYVCHFITIHFVQAITCLNGIN